MNTKLTAAGLALAAVVAGTAAAGAVQPPRQPPADRFTTKIDNPYFPLRPGSRWVYRETHSDGAKEKVVVTVTNETKLLANGVTARVVRDTVTEKGELVEDTLDWYAQDRKGNVWYMGEATKDYENGQVVSTKGSWEAGVDGAKAGIIMPAKPRPGREYYQEFYRGHALDQARVLSIDDQAEVPAGHFRRTLLTKDWNPLDPKALEYKLYAKGVGLVLAVGVSGNGGSREELIRFTRG